MKLSLTIDNFPEAEVGSLVTIIIESGGRILEMRQDETPPPNGKTKRKRAFAPRASTGAPVRLGPGKRVRGSRNVQAAEAVRRISKDRADWAMPRLDLVKAVAKEIGVKDNHSSKLISELVNQKFLRYGVKQ